MYQERTGNITRAAILSSYYINLVFSHLPHITFFKYGHILFSYNDLNDICREKERERRGRGNCVFPLNLYVFNIIYVGVNRMFLLFNDICTESADYSFLVYENDLSKLYYCKIIITRVTVKVSLEW